MGLATDPETGQAIPLGTSSHPWVAWRGVTLIATTYIYFLIFAQFGFLKRLAERGIGVESLTPAMAAMAAGGILASLFGQRVLHRWAVELRLGAGLVGCAAAAFLSLLPLNAWSGAGVAALIGISLGLLTVTLVAHLRRWTAAGHPLLSVALGTGLGYFACNLPWLFNASPRGIALVSGIACLLAVAVTRPVALFIESGATSGLLLKQVGANSFPFTLLAFTALIWLDSAAFFIIQNSPSLKSGTWGGAAHLWRNGTIHLAAALASAWLLARRGLLTTLLCAFAAIGAACLLLHDPSQAPLASLLYPAGVSLYSVALVAYPSFLLTARSDEERERQAGILYAVAGWIGSAMGIGMGQHLHRVPTLFLIVAGLAIGASPVWKILQRNRGPALAASATVLLGFLLRPLLSKPALSEPGAHDQIAQGRQIYIAEGCIHCHSQYVRPHDAADQTMWGPSRDIETIRREHPPLIGNRRQGPDLSEVGSRRSRLWLRMHFVNARDVSYRSIMPGYDYLFSDRRGEALIAYVSSLKTPDSSSHLQTLLASWTPAPSASPADETALGQQLFQNHCATCHVAGGRARTRWAGSFHPLPPNLFGDALALLPLDQSAGEQSLRLERIIKFGVPGTNMPGHEYLPDDEIVTLARWVIARRNPAPMASVDPRLGAASR